MTLDGMFIKARAAEGLSIVFDNLLSGIQRSHQHPSLDPLQRCKMSLLPGLYCSSSSAQYAHALVPPVYIQEAKTPFKSNTV